MKQKKKAEIKEESPEKKKQEEKKQLEEKKLEVEEEKILPMKEIKSNQKLALIQQNMHKLDSFFNQTKELRT